MVRCPRQEHKRLWYAKIRNIPMKEKTLHYKIGMVFGVFDGLHAGHRYFLTQASKRCEKLIVVVTLPEIVALLKKRLPHHGYEERVAEIRTFDPELKIVPSDKTLGGWNVMKKYAPEIIFLGYDQQAIARELTKTDTPFVFLDSHHPEKHKSSLLNTRT